MKKLFAAVIFFTAFSFSLQAQSPLQNASPLELVQLYVSPADFPDKFMYFCCEMYQEWNADSTLGQLLPKRVQRECELVWSDSNYAAVSVYLYDSITTRNVYFYLVKRKNWTIYAARSLVNVEAAKTELKHLDSIPSSQRGKVYLKKYGHSFQFDYNSLKLWTGTDADLVNHFNTNQTKFIALQTELTKRGYYGKTDSLVKNAITDKKIRKRADQLYIRDFRYDPKYPGAVFYLLGGVGDNTVGYCYQPNEKKVPPMSEKRFILVKPLGNGWYLFKTT
jgi:hypothetical protein